MFKRQVDSTHLNGIDSHSDGKTILLQQSLSFTAEIRVALHQTSMIRRRHQINIAQPHT